MEFQPLFLSPAFCLSSLILPIALFGIALMFTPLCFASLTYSFMFSLCSFQPVSRTKQLIRIISSLISLVLRPLFFPLKCKLSIQSLGMYPRLPFLFMFVSSVSLSWASMLALFHLASCWFLLVSSVHGMIFKTSASMVSLFTFLLGLVPSL
jgi:hypothetical protein